MPRRSTASRTSSACWPTSPTPAGAAPRLFSEETSGSSRWSWWKRWISWSSSARIRPRRQTTRWTRPTPGWRTDRPSATWCRTADSDANPPPPTDAESPLNWRRRRKPTPISTTWPRPLQSRTARRGLARPMSIRARRPRLRLEPAARGRPPAARGRKLRAEHGGQADGARKRTGARSTWRSPPGLCASSFGTQAAGRGAQ